MITVDFIYAVNGSIKVLFYCTSDELAVDTRVKLSGLEFTISQIAILDTHPIFTADSVRTDIQGITKEKLLKFKSNIDKKQITIL